jgi:hypothetical protein
VATPPRIGYSAGKQRHLAAAPIGNLLMPLTVLIGLLLLIQAPAAPPPEHFFVGRTEGQGTVRMMLSGRHAVRDRSHGRMEGPGVLLIDQVVEEEGKPARRRTWRLVRQGANGVTGSISDARGPIRGEVNGNVLHLRYTTQENVSVDQWIVIHPSGRTAFNRMSFSRLGLNVATMTGTIRRLD